MLELLTNVYYCSYSWKLGRSPKPRIIPKVCGWLATSRSPLFRTVCVVLSNNDASLRSVFAHLVTIFPWEMEVYIQAREMVNSYFFPFSLSRLNIASAPCIYPFKFIMKYMPCKTVLCLLQETFSFLGKNHREINMVIRKQVRHAVPCTNSAAFSERKTWNSFPKCCEKLIWAITTCPLPSSQVISHLVYVPCRMFGNHRGDSANE